jgi:hypothetical protein
MSVDCVCALFLETLDTFIFNIYFCLMRINVYVCITKFLARLLLLIFVFVHDEA